MNQPQTQTPRHTSARGKSSQNNPGGRGSSNSKSNSNSNNSSRTAATLTVTGHANSISTSISSSSGGDNSIIIQSSPSDRAGINYGSSASTNSDHYRHRQNNSNKSNSKNNVGAHSRAKRDNKSKFTKDFKSTDDATSDGSQFLKSNFRFVIHPNANTSVLAYTNPDEVIPWEDVVEVVVRVTEYGHVSPITCPICLDTPSFPQVTQCGHIFW